MLQKLIIAGILFLALYAFGENHVVVMKSISYEPKTVLAKVGDTVEWDNKSYTEHSATSNTGIFETGMVAPKKTSKAVTFKTPGDFPYHCSMHGMTMSGHVVVSP